MTPLEQAFAFDCHGEQLVGILHPAAESAQRGVLIVVGGPQYRVGSHRQFLLLARALATAGVPALRFDYRGMGDAEGAARDFTAVDDDLRAAIDAFFSRVPSLREVVIWGLCDAASAALFYAWRDTRVSGLVLLNPWVRTETGIAKAYLKTYYLKRLRNPTFWQKLIGGRFDLKGSLKSLLSIAGAATSPRTAPNTAPQRAPSNHTEPAAAAPQPSLPERMAADLQRFNGAVLIILSGNDLTAAEFKDIARNSRRWRRLLRAKRIERHDLHDADHTFSRQAWRDQVAELTLEWLGRQ